jgi:hypothetical protein
LCIPVGRDVTFVPVMLLTRDRMVATALSTAALEGRKTVPVKPSPSQGARVGPNV